jgi:hypothetical protein
VLLVSLVSLVSAAAFILATRLASVEKLGGHQVNFE